MNLYLLLIVLTVTVLIAVLALVREVRFRQALQRLIARLLNLWRNRHAPTRSGADRDLDAPGPGAGPRL